MTLEGFTQEEIQVSFQEMISEASKLMNEYQQSKSIK